MLRTILLLAWTVVVTQAQDLTAAHNLSSITGTWSTGSQAVITGPGFANPANMSFKYPKNTGESYSFTDDGFYELARYRFLGNGSMPTCIIGVVVWSHGRYEITSPNNSIILTPFGDGYQQVQDSCAAVSNFVENYNQTETFSMWRIFRDPVSGYKLHLWKGDGTPVAPQFQVSTTPNMLPTRKLRNVTAPPSPSASINNSKRDVGSAASASHDVMNALAGAGLLAGLAGLISII